MKKFFPENWTVFGIYIDCSCVYFLFTKGWTIPELLSLYLNRYFYISDFKKILNMLYTICKERYISTI